nr:hypothetical protein [Tanacetum cinerariifolium]
MSSFDEFICYGCEGPSDTPLCYLCTCEHCGNILMNGTCSKCNSGAGNSFTYDLIPKSLNEVQSISNPPPQSHYNIYLYQICESNSHYGYECSQRIPLVYEPEPCYNQSFGDNEYPHDFPGSIPPGIDEADCDTEEEIRLIEKFLYDNSSPRPPEEFIFENSDSAIESFSPSPILVEDSDSLIEEIDLSFTPDDLMPPGIEEDDYDSKWIFSSLKNCLAMIPFHFLKMSHFILIIHHPFALLRNHRMMIQEF